MVDGLAFPLERYANDPEMSEMFRKVLPYTLDVSVLQEQCPNERYFEASPFNNPVEIKPKPDIPLDPGKVGAAQA